MSIAGSEPSEKCLVEDERQSPAESPKELTREDSWAEDRIVKDDVSKGDFPDEDDDDDAISIDDERCPDTIDDSMVDQAQTAESASQDSEYDEQYERECASQLARPPGRLGSTSVFSPDSSDEEDEEGLSVQGEPRQFAIQNEEQLQNEPLPQIMEEDTDSTDPNSKDPTITIEMTSALGAGYNNIPRKRSLLGLSARRNDLSETEDLVITDPNASPPYKKGQLRQRRPGPLKEIASEFLREWRARTNENNIAIRQRGEEAKDPVYTDQHELHDMLNSWVDEVARLRANTVALSNLEREKTHLIDELGRLQHEMTEWTMAHEDEKAKCMILEQNLSGLVQEYQEMDNQNTVLQITNDDLRIEIADLELKLEKLSKDCDGLQNGLTGAQSGARSQAQPNPPRENCLKLQQEIVRLQEELNRLRVDTASQPGADPNTNPELQERLEELMKEMEQLRQDLVREKGITAELKEQQIFSLALSSSRQGEKWAPEMKRTIADIIASCMKQADKANPPINIQEIIALLDENLDIEQIAEWLDGRGYRFKPRNLFRNVLFSGDAFSLGLVAAYLSIPGFLEDPSVRVSVAEYIELHDELRQEWNENIRHMKNDLEAAEFKSNSAQTRLAEMEKYTNNLGELGKIKELFKNNPNLANELAECKRTIREQTAEIKGLTATAEQDYKDTKQTLWDLQTLRTQKDALEKTLKEREIRRDNGNTLTQTENSEELAKRDLELQQSYQELQATAKEVKALRLKVKTFESGVGKGSSDGESNDGDTTAKHELKNLRQEYEFAMDRAQKKLELSEKHKKSFLDAQEQLQKLQDVHSRCVPSNSPPKETEQSRLSQPLELQISEYQAELANFRSQVGSRTVENEQADKNLKIAMVNIALFNRKLSEREEHVKLAMAHIARNAAGSKARQSQLMQGYQFAVASIAQLNLQCQDISNENSRLVQESRAASVESDRAVASLTADVARLEAERQQHPPGTANVPPPGNNDTAELERLRKQLATAVAHTQALKSQIALLTKTNEELDEKLRATRHDEAGDSGSLDNRLSALDRENQELKDARKALDNRLAFSDWENRELRNVLENTESRNKAQIQEERHRLQNANERLAEVNREHARLVADMASQQKTGDVSGLDNSGAARTRPSAGLTDSVLPIPHYIHIRPAQNTVDVNEALRQWDAACNARQMESEANNLFAETAAYLKAHFAVEPNNSRSKLWSHAGSRRARLGVAV